jgi:pantoate--beta-alanine ligase
MLVCYTKHELRQALAGLRAKGSVGLVPTMGYLHAGHMALVARARAENDVVAVSIFVNPTQFGANEDLDSYPRNIMQDLQMLRDAGVDVVFTPDADEVYLPDSDTYVETGYLSRVLIGRIRPGHFRGVATVVTKLFNIFQPDRAYFGRKDYQQLTVIKKMVADLDIPVEVIGIPTVREADGLALSSRNVRLSTENRTAAPVLCQSLDRAEALVAPGNATVQSVKKDILDILARAPSGLVESVDIRDAETLAPIRGRIVSAAVVLLTVRFEGVLLIDQRVVNPS